MPVSASLAAQVHSGRGCKTMVRNLEVAARDYRCCSRFQTAGTALLSSCDHHLLIRPRRRGAARTVLLCLFSPMVMLARPQSRYFKVL